MLDENRHYKTNGELMRWGTKMKQKIEEKTFQDRGKSDYDRYLREELEYNNTNTQNSRTKYSILNVI